MTQSPRALALLDEPLDGAVREVADDPVDGDAPALDHHPGLAGRDHDRRGAVAPRRRDQLQGDRHLADRAVRPDRQDHPLARAGAAARPPSPSGRAAAGSRSAGCRPPPPPPRTPDRRRGTGAARNGCRGRPRSPRGSSPARPAAAARRSARCRSAARRVGPGRRAPRRASRRTGCRRPGRNSRRFRPAIVESRIATISSRP